MSRATATKSVEDNAQTQNDIIKKRDLASRLGVSVRQIELMVKRGSAPKPFYLGDSSPRWRKADIDAWPVRLATEAQQA